MTKLLERTGVCGGDGDWDNFLALAATADQLEQSNHWTPQRIESGVFAGQVTTQHVDFPFPHN